MQDSTLYEQTSGCMALFWFCSLSHRKNTVGKEKNNYKSFPSIYGKVNSRND